MGRILSYIICLLTGITTSVHANGLDDIKQTLMASSMQQTQEKVFVHTDNQCYFVGDTLWYKAYVVRADDLKPTDMSRLLYVELLSPDGMLVERQTVIVSPTGFTCGQFALTDSLYSGYYELRAYTRWNLNFNVREHYYRKEETWWFYNKQMAADYYRVWDGLYSRVLPIYSKPEKDGDYDARYMFQRPKTRLPRKKKDDLVVTFYPEGGHLIDGIENRVAFDVTDQHGEAINIKGTIDLGNGKTLTLKTEHMGRGVFNVTPNGKRLHASFHWHSKDWTIDLPKAEMRGATFRLDGNSLDIKAIGLPEDKDYAVSILCRGALKHFEKIALTPKAPLSSPKGNTNAGKPSNEAPSGAVWGASATLTLPFDQLPTGVADITLFDSDGQILADRLCFVNNHEHDSLLITAPIERTHTYSPYERVDLPIQLHGVSQPTTFSLSIRDSYTNEATYDDGNLMTDLLLSSELRGFIAHPAYYFEADDEVHRHHLDLLMMVQGWRKYKWQELAEADRPMRYEPEKTLTVEGAVYKMLGITPVGDYKAGYDEITEWQFGRFPSDNSEDEIMGDAMGYNTEGDTGGEGMETTTGETTSSVSYSSLASANDNIGVNHGNLRHEVLVEAEVALDDRFVGGVQETKNGRFIFEVPPFYGLAYLKMKAYNENDSVKKNMASRKDAKVLDEDAFPDYYVKRDIFFPVFTHDYNYYEKHQPNVDYTMLVDTVSEYSMENDVHELGEVNVKGRRRGRRAVDWKKPAYVVDAYDLYNDLTDRGLSFGKLDMRQFPVQVCKLLFGNMNRPLNYNVDGRIEGHVYYRNYSPFTTGDEAEQAGLFVANRTSTYLYRRLKLKRLKNIRVFTDYEPRTEDSLMTYESHTADATVDLELIPNDGVQPTFRDRHILLRGINLAEEFYQPDYSARQPEEPTDHRRTLYWNPNAVSDSEGRFTATFYNNSKETRITMSAAGVTLDGQLLHSP